MGLVGMGALEVGPVRELAVIDPRAAAVVEGETIGLGVPRAIVAIGDSGGAGVETGPEVGGVHDPEVSHDDVLFSAKHQPTTFQRGGFTAVAGNSDDGDVAP